MDNVDKIQKEIAKRDANSKEQQKDIDKETDAAKKAQKQKDKDDYDQVTAGMQEVANALKENPKARPGAVIPRLRDVEAVEVHKLEGARDEANRRHDGARVKELDRQIELANKKIEGKGKANDLLALGPGGGPKEGEFAMRISIDDDAGRQLVSLRVNLYSGLDDVLVLPAGVTLAASTLSSSPSDSGPLRP